jgi:ribosome-associated translation inhibitor RaiA
MSFSLQITFRDIDHSPAMERAIRLRARKLDRYCDGINTCRIVVESPHRSRTKGNHVSVRIDLTVPGHEIVVTRGADDQGIHEDPYVVIREAFEVAVRELKRYAQRRRGDVKRRPLPAPAPAFVA